MLILVMGNNFVMMFIGWEGVGLCSFLLIGFWFTNPEYIKAAKKAFIMNRIGDVGFLLAMFWIFKEFGTLEYVKVFSQLAIDPSAFTGFVLTGITLLLFLAATGKSAQLPLFTWLPDAMAGPTPVSALIHAATMVTAGIFMITRCNELFTAAPFTLEIIQYVGIATAFVTATIAMRQNDIKKVLAYSTVSQLGLMFAAIGSGAYIAAVFHVMTHAFFKALLFLGSGSVIHAMSNEQDMRLMGGLKKKIPVTHITFLIGTLAISGFPFLSGMISKDEILTNVYGKNPILWVVLFIVATMTAIYMFRAYYLTFHGEFRGTEEQKHHLHESPANMTIPLIVLAVLSVLGGFINLPHFIGHGHYAKLAEWLKSIYVYDVELPEVPFGTEMILLGLTVLMVFVVWFVVKNIYVNKKKMALPDEKYTGWERLSNKKLFLDEIYNATFVKMTEGLGIGGNMFDKGILNKFVEFIGIGAEDSGRAAKKLQNGNVENYVLIMSLAIGIILIVNFLLQ